MHLKHLLVGGSGLLVVLLVLGVPLTTALSYALALACPLMMLAMHAGYGGRACHHASEHQGDTGNDTGVQHRLP